MRGLPMHLRWKKELDPVVTPTLGTFHHLTQLSLHKQAFVDHLPMQTLNPLYRRINKAFEVKRWIHATEEQSDWNQKEEAFLMHIVKVLDDEGVRLLVGSDAGTLYMPPGTSTHREMQLMVEAGLSEATVLKAATFNAAHTLGIQDQFGTIELGEMADLVLVRANPLEHPLTVIKSGQWISRKDLQSLRQSGDKPPNLYVSVGRLLEDLLTRFLD
ncbi:MAG: amidohydrolase family protein [Verrucomicrobiota bacterium]|nr:amidohydrolase family protein [Verrucomicrobiota bacterium]